MSLLVDFNGDGSIDFTAPLGATYWHEVKAEITAPKLYRGIRFSVRKEGSGNAVLAEMRVEAMMGCTAPPVTLKDLAIGESCTDTTECGAGTFCCKLGLSACSECCPQDETPIACPSGVACQTRGLLLPPQCAPGTLAGGARAPCLLDSDCQSDTCLGVKLRAWSLGGDAGTCDLADPKSCIAVGGHCL